VAALDEVSQDVRKVNTLKEIGEESDGKDELDEEEEGAVQERGSWRVNGGENRERPGL
jgi:hypothetical protein